MIEISPYDLPYRSGFQNFTFFSGGRLFCSHEQYFWNLFISVVIKTAHTKCGFPIQCIKNSNFRNRAQVTVSGHDSSYPRIWAPKLP